MSTFEDRVADETMARYAVQCFARYCEVMFPVLHRGKRLRWKRHHDLIAALGQQFNAALTDVRIADQQDDPGIYSERPMIVAFQGPPKIGKTLPLGQMLQTWRLLQWPDDVTLSGSHSIKNHGRKLIRARRKLLQSPRYQLIQRHGGELAQTVRLTKADEELIITDAGGHMFLTSTLSGGGVGLGEHAWWHYIDDAHKPTDMIGGAAVMERHAQVLGETMGGRFIGPRCILLNMQRLGAGDTHDLLEARYPGLVTTIALPRAYEPERYDLPKDDPAWLPEVVDLGPPDDVLRMALEGHEDWAGYGEDLRRAGLSIEDGRLQWRDWRTEPGELLEDPAYTQSMHEADQAPENRYGYDTQQRQIGRARGAGIIKQGWWDAAGEWERLPGRPHEMVIVCDPQTGMKAARKYPDRTSILVHARWDDQVRLIERIKGQLDVTETARVIYWLARRHPGAKVRIEDNGFGPSVLRLLRGHVNDLRLIKREGSTPLRLSAIAYVLQRGAAQLPAPGARRPPWLPDDEPWPCREFTVEGLPTDLVPKEPDTDRIATQAPGQWVPNFREEVCGVRFVGKPLTGYDDDADALSLGIIYYRDRLHAPRGPAPDTPNPYLVKSSTPRRAPRATRRRR